MNVMIYVRKVKVSILHYSEKKNSVPLYPSGTL